MIVLFSILGNELLLDYVLIDKQLVFIELSCDDSSEKEFNDLIEDEYFRTDLSGDLLFQSALTFALKGDEFLSRHPLIEIQSPPPKK